MASVTSTPALPLTKDWTEDTDRFLRSCSGCKENFIGNVTRKHCQLCDEILRGRERISDLELICGLPDSFAPKTWNILFEELVAAKKSLSEIQAVLISVGCLAIDQLKKIYLDQMERLTKRDMPPGFDSWEAYHQFVMQDRRVRIPKPGEPCKIHYKNWKEEERIREICPVSISWMLSEFHPEKQWILLALDLEKGGKLKHFALKDCTFIPS